MKHIENGIEYRKIPNKNEYAVMGLSNLLMGGNIIIRSTVNGLSVTTIDDAAFRNNKHMVTVELPSTLQVIGDMSFAGCNLLQTVIIDGQPNNIVELYNAVFYDCTNLTTIISGPKLNLQGNEVFANCERLHAVEVNFVDIIPEKTFYNCEKLEVIMFEKTIEVADSAFYGCSKLRQMIAYEEIICSPKFIQATLPDVEIYCSANSNFIDLAYEGFNINIMNN